MNIEYDIKEILIDIKQSFDKIDARFEKMDARFDKLDAKVDKLTDNLAEMRSELIRVEESLKGELKVLDQKVDGISKRVDTQDFINRGVIVGLVLTILGGFVKLFGLR